MQFYFLISEKTLRWGKIPTLIRTPGKTRWWRRTPTCCSTLETTIKSGSTYYQQDVSDNRRWVIIFFLQYTRDTRSYGSTNFVVIQGKPGDEVVYLLSIVHQGQPGIGLGLVPPPIYSTLGTQRRLRIQYLLSKEHQGQHLPFVVHQGQPLCLVIPTLCCIPVTTMIWGSCDATPYKTIFVPFP